MPHMARCKGILHNRWQPSGDQTRWDLWYAHNIVCGFGWCNDGVGLWVLGSKTLVQIITYEVIQRALRELPELDYGCLSWSKETELQKWIIKNRFDSSIATSRALILEASLKVIWSGLIYGKQNSQYEVWPGTQMLFINLDVYIGAILKWCLPVSQSKRHCPALLVLQEWQIYYSTGLLEACCLGQPNWNGVSPMQPVPPFQFGWPGLHASSKPVE